jgi:hypothetical protein
VEEVAGSNPAGPTRFSILLGNGVLEEENGCVRPPCFWFPIVVAVILSSSAMPFFGQTNTPLAVPRPELYQIPKPPRGNLGLPLGTFTVIEGIQHPYGMEPNGAGFAVEVVNGKKMEHVVSTPTQWPSRLSKSNVIGKHYVLHGYETGSWHAGDANPAPGEEYLQSPRILFVFSTIFVVTSIEKIDGITLRNAMPVNSKVPLAVPDFASKTDEKPPIGCLGLPLGTLSIIEARASKEAITQLSPCEVLTVNGKSFDKPVALAIINIPLSASSGLLKLRGYEDGFWEGEPEMPKSEIPTGDAPEQSFHFFERFVPLSSHQPTR